MNKKNKKTEFTPKFKANALAYADKFGVKKAAENYNVNPATIYNWKNAKTPKVIEMNLLDDAPTTLSYPDLGGGKERKLKVLEAEIAKLKSTIKFLLNLD